MAGNAFSVGTEPTRADVFQFLWRMNPAWRKGQPITFASTRAWWAIHRVIYRHSLPDLEAAIVAFLAVMLQDMPEKEQSGGDSRSSTGEYVTWAASECDFYMRTYHMTRAEYWETPFLVLQQLYRAYRHATDENATFINASDKLVTQWIRRASASTHGTR